LRIDLHTHSSVSDGTDSPAELVRRAAEAELDVIAVTDHDTTEGWAEAATALPGGVRLVRGAELSCLSPDGRGGQIPVHLLAYLFDPEHPAMHAEQLRQRDERRERLHRMATLMARDGFPIDPDQFLAALPEKLPAGRPHLARALIEHGVVASIDEAFATVLHTDGPYYLRRRDLPIATAIDMVHAAGGVSVFAHPLARRRGGVVEISVIRDLAGRGLAGVEVDHPDQVTEDRAILRQVAFEQGLLAAGSSDYHGSNKTIELGAETTDPEVFDQLIARDTAISVLG
jgi:predicted metal-dependent phosphoesterase TrpH